MWFDSNIIVDYTVVDTPPHNKAVFQKKVVLKNMPCRNSFVIKLLFLSLSGLICRWSHLNRIKNKKVIEVAVLKMSTEFCRCLQNSADFRGTSYTSFFVSQ